MSDQINNPENTADDAFALPEGYFANAANKLRDKIACMEELSEFPVLSGIEKHSGFDLPEFYFEKSAQKLENIPYTNLTGLKKEAGFIVSDGYFETNSLAIHAAIEGNDEDVVNRLKRFGIDRENAFTLPTNYFEDKQNTLRAIGMPAQKKQGKVVRLYFLRAGMAAAAILLITFGLKYFKTEEKQIVPDDCGTLACIERRELLKSKQIENLDDEELLEIVNPKTLEQSLKDKGSKINNHGTKDSAKLDQTTDELLDEI